MRDSRLKIVRFGIFEVDLRNEELRRSGVKLKLQKQPFQILAALLAEPGQVVTREALRDSVWTDDTFVDFDHGLNKAVSTLRSTLGDSTRNPRFIETVPGQGYRFVAPVETHAAGSTNLWSWRRGVYLGAALLLVLLFAVAWWDAGRFLNWDATRVDSLAVLPLDNFSEDADQDYLAEGVTEALITELSQLHGLRVISRQSVLQYRSSEKTLAQIGRELDVDAVIEGSVMRDGDRIRVTAQLLRVTPEEHLWAGSFDRELTDILALQAEVARTVAAKVDLALTPEEEARLADKPRVNPAAHEAYLRARFFFNQYSPAGIQKGMEYIQQALAIDDSYAPAWAASAPIYGMLAYWGFQRPKEMIPRAETVIRRALELDNTLALAHAHMGAIRQYFYWDWDDAGNDLRRAIDLSPADSQIRLDYALHLASLGRLEQARDEIAKGREADPFNPILSVLVGLHEFLSYRFDVAAEQLEHTLEAAPNLPVAHWFLWKTYRHLGKEAEAWQECKRTFTLWERAEVVEALEQGYADSGYRKAMLTAGHRMAELFQQRYVAPTDVAMFFVHAGELDQAMEWLERGYEERDPRMHLIYVDPDWDPLRSDDRFQQLLKRMNFRPNAGQLPKTVLTITNFVRIIHHQGHKGHKGFLAT